MSQGIYRFAMALIVACFVMPVLAEEDSNKLTPQHQELDKSERIEQLKKQSSQFEASGDSKSAVQSLQALTLEEPEALNHKLAVIKHLLVQNRLDRAEQELTVLFDEFSESEQVYVLAGDMKYMQGNLKQALSYYKVAIDLNPNNPDSWYKLAGMYFQLQNIELAEEAMAKFESLSHSNQ